MLTQNGIFHIFAIDHRDVLTVKMDEKLGKRTDDAEVLNEKLRLIGVVSNMASAVLVDTYYFIHGKKLDEHLDMNQVLIGIERNNYDISKIGDGYLTDKISIRELAENGCNMIKLFAYYQPDMEFTDEIDNVIGYVVDECKKYEIPLMLEPILYRSTPETKLQLTRDMLNRLKKFDIDIYKIDFPGDLQRYSDEENCRICTEINNLLAKPWIILSSGITLKDFEKQLKIAGNCGASGYAIGRSVWNNFILEENLDEMERIFAEIKEVAEKYCQKCSAR